MKIAIFSDCYLDLTGGIVTVINTEKEELERRGHTVYVFSSAYPKTEKEQQQLARNHIYPVKSCKFFFRGLSPIARRPKIVEEQILQEHPEIKDFDIFYIHYEAGCSIAGIHLARKFHKPVIQVMHGREDVGESSLIPHGLRTIVAICLNKFHSWYLPHTMNIKKDDYLATSTAKAKMWTLMVNHANAADIIITPSEHFKNKLTHYGVKPPITILHHGVADELVNTPVAIKSYQAENGPLEIIWHSRVSKEKRIMPFLEALKKVQNRRILPYHLSVYGDGNEMKNAKSAAVRWQLNVDFYGNVSHDKVREALKKSHLDALTSYGYDTFGMTLIEAAATGTPVLIVDPDLTEILPQNSYILADSPSYEDMAYAMIDLLKHPERVEQMSALMLEYRPALKNSLKIDQLLTIFQHAISQ